MACKSKPIRPNLPNQTKITKETKAKHQNKIHEQNWQIQTMLVNQSKQGYNQVQKSFSLP